MNNALRTLTLLACFAPLGASADSTFTYPKSHPVLSVSFPDSWKVTPDSEDAHGLVAESADKAIELDVWAMAKDADGEETGAEIAEDIKDYVTDFEVKEQKKGEINGMKAAMFGGVGKSKEDGSAVNVEVMFFTPNDEQIFGVMYWGSDEAEKKHDADLKKIADSIKKAS